jgi:SnoaL-like domain
MAPPMDAVDRLEAVEAIKQLKARYFRMMDTKDWDGFAAVFAPDAVMDMSGEMRDSVTEGEGITRGNTAIAEFVKRAVHPVETVHHGHMPEIEITSPTTARGVWSMEDKLRWPAGSPLRSMHGYGHYHETYEKVDGRWLIKTIALTRLRVDTETA